MVEAMRGHVGQIVAGYLRSEGFSLYCAPMRSLVAAVALCLVPALALAQAGGDERPEGETPPQLVPPSIAEFVEATYPPDAEAQGLEANVELEITIGADGLVTDARVVTPAGHGFDEAALEAVRRFRFEPARRGTEAIPSRIRYRYVFELRTQTPETDPDPDPDPDVDPEPVVRTGNLEGRVLAAEDGEPIEGVEVLLEMPEDPNFARRALTGADGRFAFTELAAGEYGVRVLGDAYGEQSHEEEVVAGEATAVTYRLAPARSGNEREQLGAVFGARARVDPPPREVTRRTIGREELTRIPGTRGDALRAVELLPGVARPPFGAGALIVRGSAPNDSQVFLEGVPVPLLYHFGGLTSFFNSRLLNRIDFFPGNFSVRYGRKMGGILEVEPREPLSIYEDRGLHGIAELSLIDASLMAEFPLGDNAAMAASVRRSTIDGVFNALPDDVFSVQTAPVYYDYQGIIAWRPSPRDRLRFYGYGSSDRFEIFIPESLGDDAEVQGSVDLTTRFHLVQLAWDRQINDRTELDVDVSAGTILLEFSLGQAVRFDARINQIQARAEIRHRASDRVRLIWGIDSQVAPVELLYQGPQPEQSEGNAGGEPLTGNSEEADFSVNTTTYRPAMYAESDMRLHERLQVVAGLRLDYAKEIDRFAFNPRLVTNLTLFEGFRLKAGFGVFSQPPEFNESAEDIGNPNLDWIHSTHTGLGFEYRPLEGVQFGVEGFYKYQWDRVVNTPEQGPPFFVNGGIGRIYGMEVSARVNPVRGRRFFGYLSYTLSRSERRDQPDDPWRLFDFDQTHIFTLASVVKLPRRWEIGATIRLVSGNPRTPFVNNAYDVGNDARYGIPGQINSERNPLFNRLDLRISKTWVFSRWKLALFLDIQNLYNQDNQESVLYNYDFSQSVPVTGLPFIPALGIRGEL